MKVGLTIRLDKDLRDSFTLACEQNDLPASLVIRELIKDYITKNSQLDLLKGAKK